MNLPNQTQTGHAPIQQSMSHLNLTKVEESWRKRVLVDVISVMKATNLHGGESEGGGGADAY